MDASNKLIAMELLGILRNETDEEHTLFLEELSTRLSKKLGCTHSRKTLRHDLEELRRAGYPLAYKRGWYYRHPFTVPELDFLLECVGGCVGLTPEARQNLMDKISRMNGKYYTPPEVKFAGYPGNENFLRILYTLRQLIRAGRPR